MEVLGRGKRWSVEGSWGEGRGSAWGSLGLNTLSSAGPPAGKGGKPVETGWDAAGGLCAGGVATGFSRFLI
jgi:hypothetical protein